MGYAPNHTVNMHPNQDQFALETSATYGNISAKHAFETCPETSPKHTPSTQLPVASTSQALKPYFGDDHGRMSASGRPSKVCVAPTGCQSKTLGFQQAWATIPRHRLVTEFPGLRQALWRSTFGGACLYQAFTTKVGNNSPRQRGNKGWGGGPKTKRVLDPQPDQLSLRSACTAKPNKTAGGVCCLRRPCRLWALPT